MDMLRPQEREDALRRLQTFFRDERGETLGDLAADILLAFIERDIAPAFYNKGLHDAQALSMRVSALFEEELATLERSPPR